MHSSKTDKAFTGGKIKITSVQFLSCADFAVGKTAISCPLEAVLRMPARPLTRSFYERKTMNKTSEEIKKEIDAIIATASSPEEALKKVSEAFPGVTYAELQKQYEAEQKKAEESFARRGESEDVENLSESDLESVAGGSFGSWMKKNWPIVAGTAVFVTIAGASVIKGYRSQTNKDNLNSAYGEGKIEGSYDALDSRGYNVTEHLNKK